jgi:hypothetical protein
MSQEIESGLYDWNSETREWEKVLDCLSCNQRILSLDEEENLSQHAA